MTLVWTIRHTWAAGAALIALTNAIALGGVAYNRSGDPDSRLELSQRELSVPYSFRSRDGSDLWLTLNWNVLTKQRDSWYGGSGRYNTPEWLDEAKLAALGFDLSKTESPRLAERSYVRQLPREALIVLELDGPAYARALEFARERAAKEEAAEAPRHGVKQSQAKVAKDQLHNLETRDTRLFAVDAGTDAAALRAKYPDRARYAIVQGKVRATSTGRRGEKPEWAGQIEDLLGDRINVPIEFRNGLKSTPVMHRHGEYTVDSTPFSATVAYGKKFEPWLVSVELGPAHKK